MTRSIEERMAVVESGLEEVRTDVLDIRSDAKAAARDLRELRDELAGRPTWAVTWLITSLTTICVALGVALINNL